MTWALGNDLPSTPEVDFPDIQAVDMHHLHRTWQRAKGCILGEDWGTSGLVRGLQDEMREPKKMNGMEDNEYDTRDRIHTEDSEALSNDEIGNAYDVHQGVAGKTVTVILTPSAFKATASAT
ncbi:hypothetical protein B0A49_12019 [Cryomyces minteri]|uniref:Uncharacterized protein n=1 Tax=Cryomyces minteri TaxID=331657 RepID=A0A4U0WNP1_9PEZI|nr:hypothetical protein B0A49_12019 [Cryomyces minteri]